MFLFLLISTILSGQTTVNIMDHSFSVGDTITLTTGTMPNGDFMSMKTASAFSMPADGNLPHLSSSYTNFKLIIAKIRVRKLGINTVTTLICRFRAYTIWVDAATAITKKEILF